MMTKTAPLPIAPAPLSQGELLPPVPQVSQVHAREEGPKAERLSFGHPVVDDFLATLPADAELTSAIRQRGDAEAEVSRLGSLLGGALCQKRTAAAAVAGLDDAAQGSAHAAACALLDGLPARIAGAEERRVLAALACIRRFTQIGQSEIQRLYDAHAPLADAHKGLLNKLQQHDSTPYGGTLNDDELADLRADILENGEQMKPLMVGDRNARQALVAARSMAQELGISSTDCWNWEASITQQILSPNTWADVAKKAGEAAQYRSEYESRGGDEARSGLRPRQ